MGKEETRGQHGVNGCGRGLRQRATFTLTTQPTQTEAWSLGPLDQGVLGRPQHTDSYDRGHI